MTAENTDPFYAWLDHEEIRDLVHRANDLQPGERIVLLKGLVPKLLDDLGPSEFHEVLGELQAKAERFHEARTHPGAKNEEKQAPGEALGGPTPEGHIHLEGHRDTLRPGGRDAERLREREVWQERER